MALAPGRSLDASSSRLAKSLGPANPKLVILRHCRRPELRRNRRELLRRERERGLQRFQVGSAMRLLAARARVVPVMRGGDLGIERADRHRRETHCSSASIRVSDRTETVEWPKMVAATWKLLRFAFDLSAILARQRMLLRNVPHPRWTNIRSRLPRRAARPPVRRGRLATLRERYRAFGRPLQSSFSALERDDQIHCGAVEALELPEWRMGRV